MIEYLHRFNAEANYNTYIGSSAYTEPTVSTYPVDASSVTVNYNLKELGEPLTFQIVAGGTLYWYVGNDTYAKTIEYSKNGGEWTEITSSSGGSGTTISEVVPGDIIKFRGNNIQYGSTSASRFINTENCLFYGYGNIMSLIQKENFVNRKNFTSDNNLAFAYMFYQTNIMSHPTKLLHLAATYFSGNLRPSGVYESMFRECKKLKRPPVIHLTNETVNECFRNMFNGCTSIQSVPKMPTSISTSACYQMFMNCTGLKTAKIDFIYWAGNNACQSMFEGCTSLRSVYFKKTNFNQWGGNGGSFRQMFKNCTSLKKINALNITGKQSQICQNMFNGCTSLEDASTVNISISGVNIDGRMFEGMFQNCKSLKKAPKINIDIAGYYCFNAMFENCTSLETAPELNFTGNTGEGICQAMFKGCTNLITPPPRLLPETLTGACYKYMFQNCTKLESAPEIMALTTDNRCCELMFANCKI